MQSPPFALLNQPVAFTLFAMAKSIGFQKTLQDLEAAFADWEALSDTPEKESEKQSEKPAKAAEAPLTALQQEVRTKTKKLLSQLREQLAELED